jgi:hypothetical protein
MQSSELWAAWIVAAVMVGLVAWVGHIQAENGGLTPASEVARRAPASQTRRPPADVEQLPAMQRIGPSLPALRGTSPASGQPRLVYLCVIDGPQQGAC